MMNTVQKNTQQGFTLFEVIIYIGSTVAILSIVFASLAAVFDARARQQTINEVTYQGTLITGHTEKLILEANSIQTPTNGNTSTSLITTYDDPGRSPTTIQTTNGLLEIDEGDTGTFYALHNELIEVIDISFQDVTDGANGRDMITMSLTLGRATISNQRPFSYEKTFMTTVAVRNYD
jgi:type II secretory pathway pseudopilin PulG